MTVIFGQANRLLSSSEQTVSLTIVLSSLRQSCIERVPCVLLRQVLLPVCFAWRGLHRLIHKRDSPSFIIIDQLIKLWQDWICQCRHSGSKYLKVIVSGGLEHVYLDLRDKFTIAESFRWMIRPTSILLRIKRACPWFQGILLELKFMFGYWRQLFLGVVVISRLLFHLNCPVVYLCTKLNCDWKRDGTQQRLGMAVVSLNWTKILKLNRSKLHKISTQPRVSMSTGTFLGWRL